jgi:predicted nucleic acid-binding protein
MTRYVIGPDVALLLAEREARLTASQRLLAPTLLRSEVLARLYALVQRGTLSRKDAERRLDHLRKLRIRLLGDRVLQRVAWEIAEELRWKDTLAAEYLALTRLQADAFVTLDAKLAKVAGRVVKVAKVAELLRGTY